VYELVRLKGLERVYDLKRALEMRGIEAQVWHEGFGSMRRWGGGSGYLRLVVGERDVVYARWVLHGAGLDVWPDPDDGEKEGEAAVS
jgi:hypothetical protein